MVGKAEAPEGVWTELRLAGLTLSGDHSDQWSFRELVKSALPYIRGKPAPRADRGSSMRALRFVLIVTICLLVLANLVRFFTLTQDTRITNAISNDTIHRSEETQQELRDATAAGHRRFIIEQTVVGFVLLCLGVGVVFTTGAIRTRAILARRGGSSDIMICS